MMKKWFQKIYLKITTFFLLRKFKKFGYKFILLFFALFLFPYISYAETQNICFGSAGSEYLVTGSRTSPFWGTGYMVNDSSFSVTPYESNKTTTLLLPKDNNYSSVINFTFEFRYESFYSTPIVVGLQVYDGSRWINAICDGELYSQPWESDYDSINQRYNITYIWQCTQLDLTQQFNQFRFNVSGLSGTDPVFTLVSVDRISYDYYCNQTDIPDTLASIEELQQAQYSLFNDMAENWANGTIMNKNYSWSDRIRMHLLEQSALTTYVYDDVDLDSLDISYSRSAVSFLYTNINSLINLNSKIKVFIITCLSLGVVALIYARRGH